MNKSLRTIIGVLVIVIGISMLFSFNPLTGGRLHDSESITLNGIDHIVVKGSSEAINIMTSSDDDLKAELSGKTSGFSLSKPQLQVKKSGNTITVKVKRSWFQLFTSSQLQLDVYISDDFKDDLSLDISSGSLEIDDSFDVNHLDIDVSSGEMIIDEINTNKTNINVSSGSLSISDFTGDIDGSISSGDLVVEYSKFNNDIKFDASSGDVDIILPKGSDFELNAYWSSGHIKTDFELQDYSKSDKEIEGIAGNGGNKIELDVSSGSIFIGEK